MSADGKLTVKVTVKNTGAREGQEVVQFYISDKKSSLPRPVKELKGFQKIKLAPGESKEVSFTVNKEALSFFDDARHTWVAEPVNLKRLSLLRQRTSREWFLLNCNNKRSGSVGGIKLVHV